MVPGLQLLSCKERLTQLGFFSLAKRLRLDPAVAFQYLRATYKKAGQGLCTRAGRDRTRENGSKWKESRFR